MSYKMYHVVEVSQDISHRIEYVEHLKSSSEKEVEAKLTELVPRFSKSCVKVFTEVEFTYKGMAHLKVKDDG